MDKQKKQIMNSGGVAALMAMFPAAFILALIWKFPLPLSGYGHGLESALLTPYAVLFYGIFTGGFILVPALGAMCGVFADRLYGAGTKKGRILSICLGIACAFLSGVFLNLLEKIIGPW